MFAAGGLAIVEISGSEEQVVSSLRLLAEFPAAAFAIIRGEAANADALRAVARRDLSSAGVRGGDLDVRTWRKPFGRKAMIRGGLRSWPRGRICPSLQCGG